MQQVAEGVQHKISEADNEQFICNVIYKIIAKVLENHLKRVIASCASEEQSAFIEGLSIIDNALMTTEIIHFMKCRRKGQQGSIALKIDISKAYDRVD